MVPAADTTPDWCGNGDCWDEDDTEYDVDATLRAQSSTTVDSACVARDTVAASAQLEWVSGVECCNVAVEVAEA